MKNYFFLIAMLLGGIQVKAQYNTITISGGYAFNSFEETDVTGTGFRLNGLYEYHPIVGKFVHGFSVGYVHTSAEVTEYSGSQPIVSDYTITSWPFYYTPKLMIGEGSFKGFVKGAAGMQFSTLRRSGTLTDVKTNDAGFYGGLGAGILKDISDKAFLNLEYEWAYSSNSYYRDGFLHSFMLGVGIKL
ncbi:MAG: hypothetical protein IPL92_07110 [Saprospiraceae bacterium]|nr:hypothetical protein [Candidatus Opimibacter iunctus]